MIEYKFPFRLLQSKYIIRSVLDFLKSINTTLTKAKPIDIWIKSA